MKIKDFIYMALAFFTVKFLRKPAEKTKTKNKIPSPEKIMDHAGPIPNHGFELHFKPAEVKNPVEIRQKPIEEIHKETNIRTDIREPFVPRKPEDMFRDHYFANSENENNIPL